MSSALQIEINMLYIVIAIFAVYLIITFIIKYHKSRHLTFKDLLLSRKEISESKDKITSLQNKNEILQNQISKITKENLDLKNSIHEMRIKCLQNKIENLTHENANLKIKNNQLLKDYKEIK